jgi:hypothetical protein
VDQRIGAAKQKMTQFTQTHAKLAKEVQDASGITISTNTPVEQAKKLLEDKESKLTTTLTELHQQTKEQMTEYDKLKSLVVKDRSLKQQATTETQTVNEAAGQAAVADDKQRKAAEDLLKAKKSANTAATDLDVINTNEKTAEGTLANVDGKLKTDEKELKKDTEESAKIKNEVQKEADEASSAVNEVNDAAAATETAKSTPVPAIPASTPPPAATPTAAPSVEPTAPKKEPTASETTAAASAEAAKATASKLAEVTGAAKAAGSVTTAGASPAASGSPSAAYQSGAAAPQELGEASLDRAYQNLLKMERGLDDDDFE